MNDNYHLYRRGAINWREFQRRQDRGRPPCRCGRPATHQDQDGNWCSDCYYARHPEMRPRRTHDVHS